MYVRRLINKFYLPQEQASNVAQNVDKRRDSPIERMLGIHGSGYLDLSFSGSNFLDFAITKSRISLHAVLGHKAVL